MPVAQEGVDGEERRAERPAAHDAEERGRQHARPQHFARPLAGEQSRDDAREEHARDRDQQCGEQADQRGPQAVPLPGRPPEPRRKDDEAGEAQADVPETEAPVGEQDEVSQRQIQDQSGQHPSAGKRVLHASSGFGAPRMRRGRGLRGHTESGTASAAGAGLAAARCRTPSEGLRCGKAGCVPEKASVPG